MKIKLTVLAFFILRLLSGQVLAFDVDGLSYSVIGATNDVRAIGCAADPCSSSDIVIPGTIVDSGITYSVKRIGTGAFTMPTPARPLRSALAPFRSTCSPQSRPGDDHLL